MSARIGCDNLVYALMTTEGTKTTAPTWGPVKSAPGVMSLGINPNASQETLFTDDGPTESAATLGAIEVEIQKDQLTTEQKADLLGHTLDSKGGLVSGAEDTAACVAIGFRTLRSSGNYSYVWLYRGKFIEPETTNETRGDAVNFQTDTITGQFAKIPTVLKVKTSAEDTTGTESSPWKYEINEEDTGADSALIGTWFDDVQLPEQVA